MAGISADVLAVDHRRGEIGDGIAAAEGIAVALDGGNGGNGTRLFFGSAVVPVRDPRSGRGTMGWVFRALLGFHRIYSRVLLRAAASRLRAAAPSRHRRAAWAVRMCGEFACLP